MIVGEAVRAVDRNRGCDPGLMERQRIDDALGEDHFIGRARGLVVEDTAERAGEVAVAWRPHAAAVERRPLPRERIRDRDDHAAAEQLAPFLGGDAEREQLVLDVAVLWGRLQK